MIQYESFWPNSPPLFSNGAKNTYTNMDPIVKEKDHPTKYPYTAFERDCVGALCQMNQFNHTGAM